MRGRGDFENPSFPLYETLGLISEVELQLYSLTGGNNKVVGQGSYCDVIITAGSHSTRGTCSR